MTLQELIEEACKQTEGSGAEVNFRNSYSGRGMYGQQCVGITGGRKDCMRVIAEVIKMAYAESIENDDIDKDDAVDTLLDHDQDSMGHDIILYWPQLASIDSAEELSDREM
jgi:hypothetical protein